MGLIFLVWINLMNNYYQLNRKDILDLIPANSKQILEIGCGFGSLGKALTLRQDCAIDGVEINPDAVPYLESLYNNFWIGNIESLTLDASENQYDCLVLSDVLEHLVDPWLTLDKLLLLLRPGGIVVISIPNIKNIGILYRLIFKGRWKYEDSGILDKTHLRFFTYLEIQKLVNGANLKVEHVSRNYDNHRGFKAVLAYLLNFLIKDINVSQYLVVASKK